MQPRAATIALALCLLAVAASRAEDNELDIVLTAEAPAFEGGLESLARGELRVTWRREGPALTVGELLTYEAIARIPEIRGRHPVVGDGCHVFASFRHGTRNRLGGRTKADGDDAEVVLDTVWEAGQGAFARLRYAHDGDGNVHLTTRMHDPDPFGGVVHYLDARPFDRLVLWVRGADDDWVALTDAAHDDGGARRELGTLDELSTATAGGGWRRLEIDPAALPAPLDAARLAEISVHPAADRGTVDLGPMALCRGAARPAPPHDLPPAGEALAGGRALWVWHTREAMAEPARRDELTSLIATQGFDRVYLQLPRGFGDEDAGRRTEVHAALATLVAALADAGAETHALDGAADFALPEKHDGVVTDIRAIVEYNRNAADTARMRGVHLDVEPYLLEGFSGDRRSEIVAGYLRLLECVGSVTTPAGLYFEVAIPFWFDGVPVLAPSSFVEEGTSFRPLSEATIDRVDAVALMDYRTRADGSAGTVALAASELAYASVRGKHVRIGLETTWLPDEETYRFGGTPTPGLPREPSSRPWIVAGTTSGGGLRFFMVPAALLPGLPALLPEADVDAAEVVHWRPSRPSRVAADRLTFHDLGIEPLQRVIAETAAQAARYPSYAGVAIHYDRTYRRLLDRP